LALVSDIDHLSVAIVHATAPAFMPGAVAGFLSILIGRFERVADKIGALRTSAAGSDPTGENAASLARRMELLIRAIYFAVLSALVTAALLIGGFLTALLGIGHGQIVAALFATALALLMASLVEFTREVRVYIAQLKRPNSSLKGPLRARSSFRGVDPESETRVIVEGQLRRFLLLLAGACTSAIRPFPTIASSAAIRPSETIVIRSVTGRSRPILLKNPVWNGRDSGWRWLSGR
jgi:hypothetical protein